MLPVRQHFSDLSLPERKPKRPTSSLSLPMSLPGVHNTMKYKVKLSTYKESWLIDGRGHQMVEYKQVANKDCSKSRHETPRHPESRQKRIVACSERRVASFMLSSEIVVDNSQDQSTRDTDHPILKDVLPKQQQYKSFVFNTTTFPLA